MPSRWESILTAATKAFAPRPSTQEPSRYSIDRSLRLIRSINQIIATLTEELRPASSEMAHVAALFCPVFPLPDPSDAEELAADLLQPFMKENEIDTVLTVLREHRTRNARMIEARLLADAVALEDFGLVGFWHQCRSPQNAGKSIEQYLKMFRTQSDYGYWSSRLRDGFYYPASRRAAADRLAHLGTVYQALQLQHSAEDIR